VVRNIPNVHVICQPGVFGKHDQRFCWKWKVV